MFKTAALTCKQARVKLVINKTMSTHCSGSLSNLRNLFLKAVESVKPNALIQNHIKLLDTNRLSINNQTISLSKPCYAVGFGKAVLGMAIELENTLGNQLERAIVTVPKGIFQTYPQYLGRSKKIQFIEGAADNIPDVEALEGAKRIVELLEGLSKEDLVIVLISGGGSALLPLPKPPITLEEKQAVIKGLSKGGATIQELNTVRKNLSLLKGGGLAKVAYPSRIVSLILSDIVRNPIDLIASGPTVYSKENPKDAIEILKKYNLYGSSCPISIKSVLNAKIQSAYNKTGSEVTPQPKNTPSTIETVENHVQNFVIGNNRIATEVLKEAAIEMGWQCVIVSHEVEADVNYLAQVYAELAYQILNGRFTKIEELLKGLSFGIEENAVNEVLRLRACNKMLLVFAGEPTVSVKGTGKGGRNQQLALNFSLQLNKLSHLHNPKNAANISLLSAGTDGIDGPTDAAGAIGYSGLVEDSSSEEVQPNESLENNDSYNFFTRFSNGEFLVKTGHTGTNVMDLHLLLIEHKTIA
ncbi:glycerate kinase [Anthonomus grandis grandis]|uniref:glycerate kinase n=1 Tax=Anthonomus grandis grandis TaxID=2921223 RepID=UPI0021669D06|nr:glycerate kinase [Anthonomus grandis grandis]